MGWTYATKPYGLPNIDYLRRQFQQTYVPGETTGHAILHDCFTGSEYFAVVETTHKHDATKNRFCLVVLVQPGAGHHGFGWKDMDESMGPYVLAPRSFFDRLEQLIPEPDGAYAAEWRARCRAHYAATANISSSPVPPTPTPKETAMTTAPTLTAQDVFDQAPLGSIIRYFDGTPEPPKRFTRKHANWERNNSSGRLVSKEPAIRSARYSLPSRFKLHEGDYGRAGDTPVIVVYRSYMVHTALHFQIIERPAPGTVQILTRLGDQDELLHLAPSQADAEAWLATHRHSDAHLNTITA